MRIGPSSVLSATTLIVSLRTPVTSNGARFSAASGNATPPMVTVLAPSMKPLPTRLKGVSSPGRPVVLASVGTICRRSPGVARKLCALLTSG